MFRIGTDLGHVGSWALLACCLLVSTDALVRHRARGLPAEALVPGAWLVHVDHIFSPYGVAGMALLGLATGAAAYLTESESPHAQPVTRQ